jgi:hypothetical protein
MTPAIAAAAAKENIVIDLLIISHSPWICIVFAAAPKMVTDCASEKFAPLPLP